MIKAFLSLAAIFTVLAYTAPALAQEAQAPSPTPLASEEEAITLADDLYEDLPAESLPTTNPFRFGLENVFYNLQNLFTFNAEKQAQLYQWRLHQLDRKAAACAQIGDDQCLQAIESRKEKLEEKTESYIEKHEEIRERLLARFQQWRQQREQHWQEAHTQAENKREYREQLMEQRRDMRKEAIQARLKKQENLKEYAENSFQNNLITEPPSDRMIGGDTDEHGCLIAAGYSWCEATDECYRPWEETCSSASPLPTTDSSDSTGLTPDQRLQNQQRLIEIRSENVRRQLEDTEDAVELNRRRQQEYLQDGFN